MFALLLALTALPAHAGESVSAPSADKAPLAVHTRVTVVDGEGIVVATGAVFGDGDVSIGEEEAVVALDAKYGLEGRVLVEDGALKLVPGDLVLQDETPRVVEAPESVPLDHGDMVALRVGEVMLTVSRIALGG